MLYDKVIRFCKENDIPIYIFEKECGLGNATISGWRTSNPRIDSLQKVAHRMGISIGLLLDDSSTVEEKK